MSTIVRRYPAVSLLVLAMIFGVAPLAAVNAGLLPEGADQLGALSASLAGIVLAAVEGRKGGVRELLGRFLIWRVGIQWWAFALLFGLIPAVASLYLFNLFGGPAVPPIPDEGNDPVRMAIGGRADPRRAWVHRVRDRLVDPVHLGIQQHQR